MSLTSGHGADDHDGAGRSSAVLDDDGGDVDDSADGRRVAAFAAFLTQPSTCAVQARKRRVQIRQGKQVGEIRMTRKPTFWALVHQTRARSALRVLGRPFQV
jgi:hypothetical protein